jgi:hypothetical protein
MAEFQLTGRPEAQFTAQTRYSFTVQFLIGARKFVTLAREIELAEEARVDANRRGSHRAFVVAAIMQSCAAIEAEVAEVIEYGPGHHLGSNGVNQQALEYLRPLADVLDDQPALERYQLVLHLLGKNPLDKGAEPLQSTRILVKLRNEIIHYKSKWGPKMESEKLYKSLRGLGLPKPPFVQGNVNFFPDECLSAACAEWAAKTASQLIGAFYEKLGIDSPINP